VDAQAYIIKITVDCNMHPFYIEVPTVIAVEGAKILKITCGEKFLTNG